ncbi:menaquinone-dependent protoporphyrinogen IX dehydrogenase [Shewanella corallii]|uniref:Protoporphyrinogen IX dehydrogenase [quinone] n=2 Tax=Shewanella TaxID=22 RepID=A0ABT0NEM6_9GAMM|nr:MULTISPECIES: menaquinone-dependent protoporphyrinogen IX dehydrogenase [Shewanella]MCL1039790.1 menaquinone-dependent protoporphyrinogen IX dehydrogenase [Shewanella submarina]MCL2916321.1 menaquinone-dependent protoporphyrinogen IX dehydrogenase [Shewanella corallii]
MKSVLVLYFSRGGHTAKIAQAIAARIRHQGHECDVLNINDGTEPQWDKYDTLVLGACVLYGTYHKSVFAFVQKYQQQLSAKPNSFFCVNVVARKPEKRVLENNKYLQKFLMMSPWQPGDLKIIPGKVDYPSWPWYDRLAIQLIMKMTDGPTDPKSVIDYTDWQDLDVYADHLLTL